MNDTSRSEDIPQEEVVPDDMSPESPALPRWVQIVAGVILLPFTLLCSGGAATIFGIPKVQSNPLLQLLAAAILLLCVWAVSLSVRLLLNLKGKGLFGPFALRVIAVAAIGLVIGGFFTGVWVDHPFRSAVLSISYVLVAFRLWKVAAYRSHRVA